MADNLFSQLDKLGLGNLENLELYEKEDAPKSKEAEKAEKVEVKIQESDFIFDKSYRCPVCDNDFKSKAVKTGKAKMLGIDMDLRPKYQDIDALKYDAIVCNKCGYAALSRFFSYVSPTQSKAIKENISKTFAGIDEKCDVFSYEEAIGRHQLSLANAVVKRAKTSEIAYNCLKLAWLMRGYGEFIEKSEEKTAEVTKKLAEISATEEQYLKKAYEGFVTAMKKEIFPICGMDEWTYIFLTAELARRAGDIPVCLKLVSEIIVGKNVSPRLKDRARELRKLIKETN